MKQLLLSFIITSSILRAAPAQSFTPGEIWPDNNGVHINAHGGGILVHQGTYYWFGEHKIGGGAGNVAHVGVHVYSSQDLYNWKDDGIALSVSADPNSPIVKGCIIERPKVIFNKKTGKFVMWFHHELLGRNYDASLSGVAVADKVTGPYTYIESFRPNAGAWPENVPEEMKKPLTPEEADLVAKAPMPGDFVPDNVKDMVFRRDHDGGQMARDMTLFVDDDGKAYHIYSSESNATLHLSQLTDDFLKPAGKYIRLFPMAFNEAPAIFKHKGKYFLISSGCTGWAPNAARLASADKLAGPWTEHGNPCVGPENQIATTFNSQSTFVLPVPGRPDSFIFMADRWKPENAIDGRYIWLPIQFDNSGKPFIEWKDHWNLRCLKGNHSVKIQNNPFVAGQGDNSQVHTSDANWMAHTRFGMFIHFGLYSIPAGVWQGQQTGRNTYSEWIRAQWGWPNPEGISKEKYDVLLKQFNPSKFDADEWISLAAKAGMKYFVITTKHHDGFALWNSVVSNYDIAATPFGANGRDPLGELAKACRKYGVKLGFYYSHWLDWEHPGGARPPWPERSEDPQITQPTDAEFAKYWEGKCLPQVSELIERYKPDMFWFDSWGGRPRDQVTPARRDQLIKLIRDKAPHCMINGRIASYDPSGADFVCKHPSVRRLNGLD